MIKGEIAGSPSGEENGDRLEIKGCDKVEI
jgi:hypothetical protein